MPEVGDIIEIPYQEGECIRCGWIVSRDGDGTLQWSGQLGGDCRSGDSMAEDGVHFVTSSVWKTRRARIAETTNVAFIMMNGDKVVRTQEFPAEGAWSERWDKPQQITEIHVSTRRFRYNAAVEDDR